MKVKKFNNLWTMGLLLCGFIIVLIYILKLFFPTIVIEVAQVESITRIGNYIDNHKWAWYLTSSFMSFFTYYFLCCACAGKKQLNIKEISIIIIAIILAYLIKEFLPTYYTAYNYIGMILLPFLCCGKFKNTVICFTTLNLLQVLTLEIRNIGLMIINYNYATFLILMIDYYITIILLYLLFNYKKGE